MHRWNFPSSFPIALSQLFTPSRVLMKGNVPWSICRLSEVAKITCCWLFVSSWSTQILLTQGVSKSVPPLFVWQDLVPEKGTMPDR